MLAVPLANGSLNLLYPIHVCHFHRLFSTIIAVVYVMLTRRSTHVSILLGIVVARIHLTQALLPKKLLGIPPPSLCFEAFLVVLPEDNIPVWIVLFKLVRQVCFRE